MLLVDNYDSFTYNLAHLFGKRGAEVDVIRNDDPALDESTMRELRCDGVRTRARDGRRMRDGPAR